VTARAIDALDVRHRAADLAHRRSAAEHHANGDEQRLRDPATNQPTFAGSFTKCLHHDEHGFVDRPSDYTELVRAIDSAAEVDMARLRIGPGPHEPNGDTVVDVDGNPVHDWSGAHPVGDEPSVRGWESPGAGSTFDLQGPDAQVHTMPPAPSFASQEVIAEMGEVYWHALCRDVPFRQWDTDPTIAEAARSLGRLWWFRGDRTDRLTGGTDHLDSARRRRRVLSPDGSPVAVDRLFRGDTPGEDVGPYLSQFLLVGNRGVNGRDTTHALADGHIAYGSVRIDQRVRVATPGVDFLTDWDHFLDVQNGAATNGRETYDAAPGYRFIATPRDLCTYVHYDALYQAYLNAALILLGLGAPFDPGLPFQLPDHRDRQRGFAQFGAPHLLSLVTEVATRALKAVRYQKYNVHRRLRPEAMGGWMEQYDLDKPGVRNRLAELGTMYAAFEGSSGVADALRAAPHGNLLAPMAFPEGSPSHPSYGSGHATVAGACVTVLKAWFDTGWLLQAGGDAIAYEPEPDGSALVDVSSGLSQPLTVEGELNKLGANIGIGRDWAGVHWYSDHHESYRLGERIALGILEEQKLCYGETFSTSVPLFDGTTVRI
jgi:hypothetical protein